MLVEPCGFAGNTRLVNCIMFCLTFSEQPILDNGVWSVALTPIDSCCCEGSEHSRYASCLLVRPLPQPLPGNRVLLLTSRQQFRWRRLWWKSSTDEQSSSDELVSDTYKYKYYCNCKSISIGEYNTLTLLLCCFLLWMRATSSSTPRVSW